MTSEFINKTYALDGAKTALSISFNYPTSSPSLEKYCSYYFFDDWKSATLKDAIEKYQTSLGTIVEKNEDGTDNLQSFTLRKMPANKKCDCYELSFTKIINGIVYHGKRTILYDDKTYQGVLTLRHVVMEDVEKGIRKQAGNAFVNMEIDHDSITFFYYDVKKPIMSMHGDISKKVIMKLSLKDDSGKFVPSFCSLQSKDEENEVRTFDAVMQMPEFTGGPAALLQWLSDRVHYPAISEEYEERGNVDCKFKVMSDGTVTNVQAIRSTIPSFEREATRILKIMPKWNAGKVNGKRVCFTFNVSFSFIIDENKKSHVFISKCVPEIIWKS